MDRKRYFARKKTVERPGRPKKSPMQMRPEIEPALKKVLAKIGKPAPASFVPDPFQLEALEAIKRTDCLVTAPTGVGKTWIAEQAIRAIFEKGGRCWYASPLKALTNAKWVEFGNKFGAANVGILTGDTKENKFDTVGQLNDYSLISLNTHLQETEGKPVYGSFGLRPGKSFLRVN